jgi:catechol 2,3-dioxygenase-like lactoylglutathione lyase family enzyme
VSVGIDEECDQAYWAAVVPELLVTDLERSLAFYRDFCGFRIRFSRTEDGFAYIELGRAQLMLEEIAEESWMTARLEQPYGRGINLQIEVSDVVSLHDRLLDMKARIFRSIKTEWYREGDIEHGQTEFLVQDPDGYLLRFMQHLGERHIDVPTSG